MQKSDKACELEKKSLKQALIYFLYTLLLGAFIKEIKN